MEFALSTLDVVVLIGGIIYALYLYGTWNYGRFINTKVPYLKPVPIMGSSTKFVLGLENLVENLGKAYNAFPESRFVGLFQMRTPTILFRDPDLIRQIAVKDFDHFVNHRSFSDSEVDPLLQNNLFFLQGQKWREMRATLSPAFTGSKMRSMYSLVSDCAQQMVQYLKKQSKKGSLDLELKDLFTRCTNDVIATTAFGLKVDSLDNPDNLFYEMGRKVNNLVGFKLNLVLFGYQLMPKVMKLLGFKIIREDCANFFGKLFHDTISIREKERIVRPDMIQLLIQAKQGTLKHESMAAPQNDAGFATVVESDVGKLQMQKRAWSKDELIAQALIFLLAGFETVATALCFTSYELALNPEVQKRLQQEIDEVSEELGENKQPDYERINRMKYLDMVISESLRMWPPLLFSDRVCTKAYNVEDYEGNKYEIKEGELVLYPAYHLHHDEKYYKNPEKFDPERFNEENKKNIQPFTYLPFGVGPRNCIGSRFALMEVKAILFNMLRNFDIAPNKKTQIPIQIAKNTITLRSQNGFWVSLVPRTT